MSPWRAVPVEATEAMVVAGLRPDNGIYPMYAAMVAAAPAFEPTPEQVERAWNAYINAETGRGGMRAALIAAFKEAK